MLAAALFTPFVAFDLDGLRATWRRFAAAGFSSHYLEFPSARQVTACRSRSTIAPAYERRCIQKRAAGAAACFYSSGNSSNCTASINLSSSSVSTKRPRRSRGNTNVDIRRHRYFLASILSLRAPRFWIAPDASGRLCGLAFD